jgi:NodT family efflux transporter outer membrane factor (OMF) lipoprotein
MIVSQNRIKTCLDGKFPALFCSLLLCLFLTACAVGPDYIRPSIDLPASWSTVADPAIVPEDGTALSWWTLFDDPLLDRFIREAAASNLDLKTAYARLEESRARLGIARGEQLPQVDATGSVLRQRTSENNLNPSATETFYNAGLDAGWEIDLFGRVRRSVEAAAAAYQASGEDYNDVMISLFADVAATYFNIRTFQARLKAVQGNILSQRQSLNLTRARFKHGLATDLDVAQAERILAASEAEIPLLRSNLTDNINALAVLLGHPPGYMEGILRRPEPIPPTPKRAFVGIPADLIRQRPDIRRAERELAAQTARIGIATADLYPSFSLIGVFGFESIDSDVLFESASRFYNFGPTVRWNIFDAKRIRNRIQVEDARTEQALLSYEQTILNALREVENAITAHIEQKFRVEALERSVKASHRSVKLSSNLYKEGLVDFQNVLDAQRSLLLLEDELARARGNSAINLVRLYKALGGGWNPDKNDNDSRENESSDQNS